MDWGKPETYQHPLERRNTAVLFRQHENGRRQWWRYSSQRWEYDREPTQALRSDEQITTYALTWMDPEENAP